MRIKKLINSFKANYLAWLSGFLLAFIPLYPKLPLADILPGYIVRIRLEDIFILLIVWLWLFVNRRHLKDFLKIPLAKWIIVFLGLGAMSVISALFVTRSILLQPEFILKTWLHFFRRVEYVTLFFLFVTSLKSRSQLKAMLRAFLATVALVVFYGFGQKYLDWPAYSTMNREFAKGWALTIGEHGRVMSTFGGHYDLAAYIMMALLVILAAVHAAKNWAAKLVLVSLFVATYWLLILTASRTSFIAFLVGITFLYGAYWRYLRRPLLWSISRYLIVVIFSLTIMMSFGDLADRVNQVVPINAYARSALEYSAVRFKNSSLYAYYLTRTQPSASHLIAKSDVPPQPKPQSAPDTPPDVPTALTESGVSVPASISAQLATESAVLADLPDELRPRTYSETALEKGLSAGIRYDTLWPRAIAGFKSNPLLGSGYATLNREHWWQFTDAESTDNDYFRMLGETGLLGLASFLVLISLAIKLSIITAQREVDPLLAGFSLAVSASLIGLLVNAWYIDVFEASKVAYTMWMLIGIMVAVYLTGRRQRKPSNN